MAHPEAGIGGCPLQCGKTIFTLEPEAANFVDYLNTRDGIDGDRGPEGLAFIKASDSPNGKPLLVVGNETSRTTAVFQINLGY